ncbi:Hypothetical protein P9211_06661 [Prochlorococcus marinus str. MIT 9211]|uniref:Uncharacterized protein n=1 Tax=Prochlorococcus marinus (strain MIT 9211) TaxID=93059 RepID=A9B9T5_PROM4|nr:Hypothetical protein P9211_06661 [Prochlorococcus marinus str. MIT 9211]
MSIDTTQIADRGTENLRRELGDNPSGTVIDYKITDGTDIGFFIRFNDNSTRWFFKNEIYSTAEGRPRLNIDSKLSKQLPIDKNYMNPEGMDKISYVMNPINFLKWFITSSKDIF